MVGPGRAIDPGEVAELRGALSRARMAHRMMLTASMRIHQIADAFDLPYDQGTVAEYASSKVPRRYCGPLPAATGKDYGQAPFADAYEHMLANPITNKDTGVPRAAQAP